METARSSVVRVGVGLSFVALVLAVAWTFVPATVTHDGTEITCHPGSVDRSSSPADVAPEVLACRPVADLRERQMIVGLALALGLIWVPCGLTLRRRRRAGDVGPAEAPGVA